MRDLKSFYDEQLGNFNVIAQALEKDILDEISKRDITLISLKSRVKEYNSIVEKFSRKKVSQKLEQIQDLIGVRAICFNLQDIENISELVRSKFPVIQAVDKANTLGYDQFGYRSIHINIALNPDQCTTYGAAVNETVYVEIQIRSMLMHAWSKIHRLLEYKRQEHIPFALRRKLSKLSALLEIADDQLMELLNDKEELKEALKEHTIDEARKIGLDTSLNVDSFMAFLEFQFPDKKITAYGTHRLLDELQRLNITIDDLINSFDKIESVRDEVLAFAKSKSMSLVKTFKFILMCGNDDYWDFKKKADSKRYEEVKLMREKLL